MKNIINTGLIAALFFFHSCKLIDKIEPDEYYMTCKIDGKEWEASFKKDWGADTEAKLLFDGTVVSISGIGESESVSLGLLDTNKQFESSISLTTNCAGCYTSHAQFSRFLVYENFTTDSNNTGNARVTSLDKNTMTVSGTFNFEAYNSKNQTVVKITDGKFRMKYELH